MNRENEGLRRKIQTSVIMVDVTVRACGCHLRCSTQDLHIMVIPPSLKRLSIDCNGADTWERFIPSYLHSIFLALWNGNGIVEHINGGFSWMTFAPCCCWVIVWIDAKAFSLVPGSQRYCATHIWASVAHA